MVMKKSKTDKKEFFTALEIRDMVLDEKQLPAIVRNRSYEVDIVKSRYPMGGHNGVEKVEIK